MSHDVRSSKVCCKKLAKMPSFLRFVQSKRLEGQHISACSVQAGLGRIVAGQPSSFQLHHSVYIWKKQTSNGKCNLINHRHYLVMLLRLYFTTRNRILHYHLEQYQRPNMAATVLCSSILPRPAMPVTKLF